MTLSDITFSRNIVVKKHIAICTLIVTILFIASFIVGLVNALNNLEVAEQSFDQFSQNFAFLGELNAVSIFFFIFLNNSIKTFIALISGFFFGIAPLLFVITNGNIIGLVTAIAETKIGISLVVASLLPHGIFEIPAILLASGYGLWLGYRFFRMLAFKEPFKMYFSFAFRKYFQIILPMLLIAAIIETFITPRLIEYLR